ncbi:Mu transposase domain-containing protein [Robertmurraya siralis]|uniref:Mu transposase domain-containing protein n=1 Tax=Robertmurraya siralis TaxID=77777 RepID=UPI0010F63310|nr:hypothetical protein [Robertmurraya siralis]
MVPDNLKASVAKHTTRELVLNPTYREMADYYNTVVMPARVRTPKDKASVEETVNVIYTWIIALRNTQCFCIKELNEEVWKKLDEFNKRPFTRKKGCRFSAFEEEEKIALSSLPSMPYKMSEWKTAKVRPDYHISVVSMFYSVPYVYCKIEVQSFAKGKCRVLHYFYRHGKEKRLASRPKSLYCNWCRINLEWRKRKDASNV